MNPTRIAIWWGSVIAAALMLIFLTKSFLPQVPWAAEAIFGTMALVGFGGLIFSKLKR